MTQQKQEQQAPIPAQARTEAQPLKWIEGLPDEELPRNALLENQRNAIQTACEIFLDIAAKAPPPKEAPAIASFLPRIDTTRQNHAVLLDGSRGSGKTAVLITLLDAWSQKVRRALGVQSNVDLHENFDKILGPDGRILPVGLVDLQPLPKSTSLIIHLVGQLYRVVEALESQHPSGGGTAQAPWYPPGDEKHLKSKEAWKQFLDAAAAGWDGNRLQRAGKLDPESYAMEFEQAERKRLHVVSSFRRLIDALVEDLRAARFIRNAGEPLFVISVDDADMNVERSVELLDLVRTLWHPRVVFLLTGDSKLFEAALMTVTLGRLMEPLRGMSVAEEVKGKIEEAQTTALKVAEGIYDKAIPKGQRLRFSELTFAERMELLKEVLKALPAPAVYPEHSLFEYLEIREQAQLLLPELLRDLMDLKLAWSRLAREKPATSAERQDVYLKALDILLTETRTFNHPVKIRSKLKALAPKKELRLTWLSEMADFSLSLSPDKTTRITLHEPVLKLNPLDVALSGRLLVAQDSLRQPGALKVALYLPPHPLASVYIHLDGSSKPFQFGWPTIFSTDSFEYSMFALVWLNAIRRLQEHKGTVSAGELARLIIRCEIDFENSRSNKHISSKKQLETLGEQCAGRIPTWPELAAEIVPMLRAETGTAIGVSTRPPAETLKTHYIALGALMLAAPEFGLPEAEANAWFNAWKSTEQAQRHWPTFKKTLGNLRKRNADREAKRHGGVEELLDDELEADLQEGDLEQEWDDETAPEGLPVQLPLEPHQKLLLLIDKQYPRHLWVKELPSSASLRGQLAGRLIGILRSIPGIVAVCTEHQEDILRSADLNLIERWLNALRGYKGRRDAGVTIVHILWKEAWEGGFAPRLGEYPGQLTSDFFSEFYDKLRTKGGEEPWGDVGMDLPLVDLSPSLRVRRAAPGWLPATDFHNTLESAIFELAYDVLWQSKQVSSKNPDPAKVQWWKAAGGIWKKHIFPWPAMEWALYFEERTVVDYWNHVVAFAEQDHAHRPSSQQQVTDLARAWVHLQRWVFYSNPSQIQWERDVNENTLRYIFLEEMSPIKSADTWRKGAFNAFAEALPLFAAPESGLSADAAEAILSFYLQPPNNWTPKTPDELHALRVLRCTDNKINPKVLAQIDKEYKDHPWVIRVSNKLNPKS